MGRKSNIVFSNSVKTQTNVVPEDELIGEKLPFSNFRHGGREDSIMKAVNHGLRHAEIHDGHTRLTSLLELERFVANYEDNEIIQTRKAARRINSLLEYMNVPETVEQLNREAYCLQFNPNKQWTAVDVKLAATKTNWSPTWLKALKRKLWKMSKKS